MSESDDLNYFKSIIYKTAQSLSFQIISLFHNVEIMQYFYIYIDHACYIKI